MPINHYRVQFYRNNLSSAKTFSIDQEDYRYISKLYFGHTILPDEIMVILPVDKYGNVVKTPHAYPQVNPVPMTKNDDASDTNGEDIVHRLNGTANRNRDYNKAHLANTSSPSNEEYLNHHPPVPPPNTLERTPGPPMYYGNNPPANYNNLNEDINGSCYENSTLTNQALKCIDLKNEIIRLKAETERVRKFRMKHFPGSAPVLNNHHYLPDTKRIRNIDNRFSPVNFGTPNTQEHGLKYEEGACYKRYVNHPPQHYQNRLRHYYVPLPEALQERVGFQKNGIETDKYEQKRETDHQGNPVVRDEKQKDGNIAARMNDLKLK